MLTTIIESIPASPHIETSGEIAINLKRQNKSVNYCWIGSNLPWNDWKLNKLQNFFGGSYDRKLNKFLKILDDNQIKTFKINEIKLIDKKIKFANKFNGGLNKLKKLKYRGAPIGVGVASSLISYFKDENINPLDYKKKTKELILSSTIIFDRSYDFLKKYNPKTIITFNNRFATCFPIICAAEILGIKVRHHEKGSGIKKYEIFENEVHDLEQIKKKIKIFWKKSKNKNKKEISKKFFQNKINNKKTNSISYTSSQKRGLLPKLPINKKIITFFTSRDYEKASLINLELDQKKNFKRFYKLINKMNEYHLVIRVHPNNSIFSSTDDSFWKEFENNNTTVIRSNENYDTYALMHKSNFVVSYSSSIVVESSYFGIPTISLGKFWWTGLNICEEPKNNTDLQKIFKNKKRLVKKNKLNCLKIAYFFEHFGEDFKYFIPKKNNSFKYKNISLTWKSDLIIIFQNLFRKLYVKV
jgi:hypothetical protein